MRFHGDDVRALDPLELRRRAVLVPQLPAPLPGSVAENVALRAGLCGRESTRCAALELAGLDALLRRARRRRASRWASSSA